MAHTAGEVPRNTEADSNRNVPLSTKAIAKDYKVKQEELAEPERAQPAEDAETPQLPPGQPAQP